MHSTISLEYDNNQSISLFPGDFFNYESLINEEAKESSVNILEPSSIFKITHNELENIPVVLWKLIETYNKNKLKL